jgi:hypothetical protein
MLSTHEVNVLGNVLNSTWGKGSTMGDFGGPSMSMKTSLQGDVLSCNYTTIVHFASEHALRDQAKVFEDESVKVTNQYMKQLKKMFKSESGRALKVKSIGSTDSIELITASAFSPRKTGYYRRFTTYTIE